MIRAGVSPLRRSVWSEVQSWSRGKMKRACSSMWRVVRCGRVRVRLAKVVGESRARGVPRRVRCFRSGEERREKRRGE